MGDNPYGSDPTLPGPQGPAAPTGLGQVDKASRGYATGSPSNPYASSYLGQVASQYGYSAASQGWYSGANAEGVNNGWDTDLVNKFIPRWNAALEDGTAAQYFDKKNATGIVTWDHTGDDGTQRKFGDIYRHGEFVGNMYDQFDRDTANQIMAEFTLDATTKAEVYSSSDRMERLNREVKDAAKDRTENFDDWMSQAQFNTDVEQRSEDFQQGPVDEIISALGAAGGGLLGGGAAGAVVGAPTGPGEIATITGGAVIGAVAGFTGAFLNKDSLTEQAARAYEITKLSTETEGRVAGLMTGLNQWSGFGAKLISPLSNLTQGIYDASQGEVGDGESEFYRTNQYGERTAPTWVRGLDVAGSVGDAMLQFASPLGVAAYSAQMSGTIAGEVGELAATGGKSFDYSKGRFDSIFTDDSGNFDLSAAAAGIGKVGIDVVQLGMARGLAGQVDSARAAVGETAAYGVLGRIPGVSKVTEAVSSRLPLVLGGTRGLEAGERRVTEKGFSYTLGADGKAVEGSRRATLSLLAPSEQLGALQARVIAQREAARSGGALTADDFYAAAHALANGDRKIQTTLVNAMGEGYEEAAQEILDAHSHGNGIDWSSVGNSALYGFAAGAGMQTGFNFRSPSADERMFADAQAAQLLRTGGTTLTRDQWKGLSSAEKRTRAQLGKSERTTMESAYRKLAEDQAIEATAGIAGTAKMLDAIASEYSRQLARATDRTDGAFVITQIEDATDFPSDAVASSAKQLAINFTNRLRGAGIALESLRRDLADIEGRLGDATEEAAADLGSRAAQVRQQITSTELMLKWGEHFNSVLERHLQRMYDPSATAETIDAESASLNDVLRKAFRAEIDTMDGEALTPADKLALARAVTAVVTRDPQDQAGSYQLLLPQVSAKLTAANADNVLEISHAVLPSLSGDYDGDKVRELNQLMLDDNEFRDARAGMNFLGAGTAVNVGAPKWEKHNVRALSEALASPDAALQALATETMTRIGASVRDRYTGLIEPDVLDEVLSAFFADLRAGSKDARATLMDGLAARAGGALTEYGREHLSNEWMWLDRLVVANLQTFQSAYANWHDVDLGTNRASSVARETEIRQRTIARAATIGNTLGNLLEGDSPFRQSQKLHYSVLNAPVLSAEQINDRDALYRYAQQYEALGANLTRSELDEVRGKDDITARVMAQLKRLSLAARELDPSLGETEALAVIANIEVTDIDIAEDGEVTSNGKTISLAQLLLKRSVAKDRRDKDAIFAASPELQAKHARLLDMTRPSTGESRTHARAQRAFVEVVGSQQLYSLLGPDSLIFGPQLTVEQFIRIYSNASEVGRREWTRKLQNDAAYLGREGKHNLPYSLAEVRSGEVSPFRAITDAILAVGNHRIAIDMKGSENREPGTLTGEIADRSNRTSKDFRAAHEQITRALAEFGELSTDGVRRLLESRPDFARSVMALIPDATAAATFDVRDNEVYIANWVHEMLAEPDAATAEMIYYRNVLLAEWNALGVQSLTGEDGAEGEAGRTYDRLPRRMHRVMWRLAAQPDGGLRLQTFIRELKEATDVNDFLRWVNTTPGIRGEQAPLTAWVDDVAEFDVDKALGGWTKALQGAELREAVGTLQRQTANLLSDLAEERASLAADTNTLAAIKRVLRADAGEKVTLEAGDRELHDQLAKAIDVAGELGLQLGPQAMIYQSVGAVRGFYPQAHTKGKNPDNVEPIGAFDALRDAYDYVTNYERVLASLTSVNLDAIGNNMSELARDGVRTMDEHGRPVSWSKPTVAQMVGLFENVESRQVARAVLFPQVMERGLDGVLRPQLLVGKSLRSLLDSTSHRDLFAKHDSLSLDSAMRYVSLVEAGARKFGGSFAVQRLVNDLVIARTSAADHTLSTAELEQMTTKAYYEVAQVLQAVASVAAQPHDPGTDPLDALRTKVRAAQRRLRTGRALGLLGEDIELTDETVTQLAQQREVELTQEATELTAQASASTSDVERAELLARADRVLETLDSFKAKVELLLSDDLTGQVVDMFTIPSDPAQAAPAKEAVAKYTLSHLNMFTRASSVKQILTRLTRAVGDDVFDGSVDPLSEAEWGELSRAVISVYLDEVVSHGSTSVSPYPDADHAANQKYFDTTFSYLTESLLDTSSPLVQAAREVHLRARRHGELAPSDTELVNLLERTILDEARLGDWTSDVPRASIEANERLDSAAAAQAIAMAGNSPKRQAVIAAATRRTFAVPGAELLSTVTLNREQLGASAFDDIAVTLPSGQVQPAPLALLTNRFAQSVTLQHTDAEGNPVTVDLLAEDRNVGRKWLSNDTVASSGYLEVSPERIAYAVDRVADRLGLDPNGYTVEVKFFHPDSQPADPEWMHNIFFEGTSFTTDADRHESLNSTLWFAFNALNQRTQRAALDASKLGKPALQVIEPPSSDTREAIESTWMVSMANMLRAKARLLFETDLGDGTLDISYFNAVMKDLKLRHFVRVENEGEVQIWTAEQVIAWQAEHPGEAIPGNTSLWVPSDDVLRAMLGERGGQGVARPLPGQLEIDLARIPTFRGVDESLVQQFTGLAAGTTAELTDTTVSARARQSLLQVRASLDDRTRAAYDARLRHLRASQVEEHNARALLMERREGGFDVAKNRERAVAAAGQFLRAENIAYDWSAVAPFIGPRRPDDSALTEMLLHELNSALAADGYRTGWIYTEGSEAQPATGLLSEVALGGQPHGMRVTYGDLVVVQVDSFNGNRKRAMEVLDQLASTGAYIVLASNNGTADMRAELAEYIEGSAGYSRVAGSPHVYKLDLDTPRYANQRARASTLVETRGVAPKNRVAVFLTSGLPIQENAAWVVPNDERLGAIAVQMNLVPTDAFADFNVPVTPEQVERTRAQLQGLADEEGRTFLHELAGGDPVEFNRAFDAMLQRFDNHPGTVLPQPGDEFGTGDLIPLMSSKGELLLYRHGHKAPKNRAAVNDHLARTLPSRDVATNVAVYSEKREEAATTHRGEVVSFNPRSGYGLSVELNIPLQQFGDKVQLEWNGMKFVLAPKPDDVELPSFGMFDGWPINLVSDLDSSFSKESYDGLVDNHRNAFAYLGMDFTGDVAEFFFPGKGQDSQARRDALTLLERIAATAPRIQLTTADDLLKSSALSASFRDQLSAFASDDWVSRLDDGSVSARIASAMIVYLMTPGARVSDVLRSGGFGDTSTDPSAQSRLMPRLFTQVFDNAPLSDPLRTEINDRLNSRLERRNGAGYWLLKNWTLQVVSDSGKQMEGMLQFAEAHSSGDNPVKNGMAFDSESRQQYSLHSSAIAYQATGASTAVKYDPVKARKFAEGEGLTRFATETTESGVRQGRLDGGLWNMLTGITTEEKSAAQAWLLTTPAEQARRDLAREAVVQFRQPLHQAEEFGWDARSRKEYADYSRQIIRALGLKDKQTEVVDYWVRQTLGMPAGTDETGNEVGNVTGRAAAEAAKDILANVKEGYLPTLGAEVPLLHAHDLQMIYRANQSRPASQAWQPREAMQPRGRKQQPKTASTWNEWTEVALGSVLTSDNLFDPLYLLALDGHLHSYQNATRDLVDLPVSLDAKITEYLLDGNTNRLLTSLDPNVDLLTKEATVLDTARASLDELIGGQRVVGSLKEGLRTKGQRNGRLIAKAAPASEVAKRRQKRREWRAANGVPVPVDVTMRNFRKNGAEFVHRSTNTNALTRSLINLRVGTALLNPALYVSMGPEQWVRGALDRLANIATGQSTVGLTSRLQAWASEPKTGEGFMSQMYAEILEATGLESRYSTEQLAKLKQLYSVLGQRSDFKGMVYRDLMYLRPHEEGRSRVEKWLEKYAALGSRIQDPTYGMLGNTLARRYVEAALQHILATPTLNNVDVDSLVAHLLTDPTWLQTHMPEAHTAGANAIAQLRSLKQTPLSLALRGIYEPLSESPNSAVNFLSNVILRMPLLFSGYAANVATTITGLQGVSDMVAFGLHGRRNIFKPWKDGATFDMEDVMEGIDLSRSFIRGGLTHTGLFVAGMMAGGLGLTGEDDEARKRRLLAENQGLGVVYDPRDIRNDFRNADAIYFDWLPFGLGTYGSEATGGLTIAQPHWLLRQFLSPVMGMSKFFETGDVRQIQWGFEDALGAFPIINTMSWHDAVETGNMLADLADAKAKLGGDSDLISASSYLTTMVGLYERMLFENSFINSIYVGMDRYDRDPYVLPLRDSDGELQTDIEGNPRKQDIALQPFINDQGELQTGYLGRNGVDALLHSLTENRATLAVAMSLFSGLGPGEADYFRYSQPIKVREQEKPPTSIEEAKKQILGMFYQQGGAASLTQDELPAIEGIIKQRYRDAGQWYEQDAVTAEAKQILANSGPATLSLLDDFGREHLTMAGAMAVVRGLVKNTVRADDPALHGVYIPKEMRDQIAKQWMKELTQEGVDLGLTETQAMYRMKRLWYGPTSDPSVQGIGDILYSKDISYSDTREYMQLNTTYVIGPDGRPWATGFTRDGLLGALGLKPVNLMVLPDSNALKLDSRGNIQDFANNANTGLRALELLDDSRFVPTDKEIAEAQTEALKEALKAQYTPSSGYQPYKSSGSNWSNWGHGGWGGYGGGGGGGGGYYNGGYANFPKMYALPKGITTYGNQIPFINTTNPIIRRADVRRERVWSERGRLKQWQ